jgi:hypothetical protein
MLKIFAFSDGPFLRQSRANCMNDLKGNEVSFVSARKKFITALLTALQLRFTDKPGILCACSVFNLTQFPITKDEARGTNINFRQSVVNFL